MSVVINAGFDSCSVAADAALLHFAIAQEKARQHAGEKRPGDLQAADPPSRQWPGQGRYGKRHHGNDEQPVHQQPPDHVQEAEDRQKGEKQPRCQHQDKRQPLPLSEETPANQPDSNGVDEHSRDYKEGMKLFGLSQGRHNGMERKNGNGNPQWAQDETRAHHPKQPRKQSPNRHIEDQRLEKPPIQCPARRDKQQT